MDKLNAAKGKEVRTAKDTAKHATSALEEKVASLEAKLAEAESAT